MDHDDSGVMDIGLGDGLFEDRTGVFSEISGIEDGGNFRNGFHGDGSFVDAGLFFCHTV
jgi:hypothetical protein